jgi:hypothetical protein
LAHFFELWSDISVLRSTKKVPELYYVPTAFR